jgi:cytoskeletal protein CcmA (bactofilin family)
MPTQSVKEGAMTMRWNAKGTEREAMPVSAPATLAPMHLDAGSELSGTLRAQRDIRVDGSIDGEIECAGTVTVSANARVKANVRASSVVIDGEVHGDIDAESEITLRKTARVHGDLTTEGIVIERGAKLEGRITIGSKAPAKAKKPAASTAPAAAAPVAAAIAT